MKKTLILSMIFGMTQLALAADTSSQIEIKAKKKVYLGLNTGREMGAPATSYELNYNFSSDLAAFVKLSRHDDPSYLPLYIIDGTIIKMGAKKFQGNSFYYTLGLFHRELDGKYSTRPEFGNVQTTTAKFRDAGASIAIGNQWSWNHLTINCEWIGYNRTLVEMDELTEPFERTNWDTLSFFNIGLGYRF